MSDQENSLHEGGYENTRHSRGRVLVTGGRDFNDWEMLDRTLRAANPTLIVHGGARGADTLAGRWARKYGVPEIIIPAQWEYYGKAAGVLRNGWMMEAVRVDLAIAFPGGRGTADMTARAKKANVPVWEISSV